MERPAVVLENDQAVYDFYLRHQQNRQVARLAYAALARRFKPRLSYPDGAREELRRLVYDDARLIIAINHLTETDPYTVAATAWSSPLRPVIGRTRVLAKDELFQESKQRRRIDMMGGIPVFRGKNHGMRAVSAAGNRMMDISAERMRRGDDLAVFPEGTCNLEDPTQVQKVGSGIGHIAVRARKLGVEPILVCIGLSYGPESTKLKSASVYIDTPIRDLPDKPIDIARVVSTGLQKAVDGAVAAY
ncbi:1-acyl-sn-glycerol-3-phosphate acyltransferase [Rhodococcus sp. BP-252]|uniref:Acyltransferase n=1 Tax=Rhodococcoides kyotonense TaxID=398843 RepID=A0A177YEE9_9NOCA|nr:MULTISPECIES: 1-acyl-sn-glycerol-3-phosphate acyltransferase [Rhodococcus]MBY6412992.1 1-acyl-sn-glycerol-3-phosphate acyltransferase [Rhodococcus sp. BP-320]MBY6418569.1 1-acyl-sn-glycerol-3-phosphate acyltransferase [Rhodococcus sp. BP-321]MBY6422729.1 1-acyl-sn-glycerol-3-phosphate acyltransferase [Rhodococcus sp. BP-324]MBY6428465.1 1-acyl-sn-glycerol-3-phosphate acyltransferase [Rhodococcus sp. BP-323]MBY6432914.1 1-acyl-sn-glycerol-3-phosphate acyltransferase [Rhodococcus sp. BP-322]